MNNKTVLEKANTAISQGDYETFLTYCTEDTKWTFVGDRILFGKEEVRRYMAETYRKPPKFNVERLIGEGDYVTAVGTICIVNEHSQWIEYDYCDIWKFENGQMAELKAFVVEK